MSPNGDFGCFFDTRYNIKMVKYVLSCILILTFVTLYLGYKRNSHGLFQQIMNLHVVSILFNVIYFFAAEQLSLERDFLLYLPFAFLYGPVLYFAAQAVSGKILSPWKIMAHLTPFLLGIVFYILRCLYPVWLDASWLRHTHHTLKTLTLLFYALYILFFSHQKNKEVYHAQWKLIQRLGFLTLIGSVIYVIFAYSNIVHGNNGNSGDASPVSGFLYLILLTSVLLVFRYTINGFMSIGADKEDPEMEPKEGEVKRYQKSMLSETLLNRYEQNLYALMIQRMVFLDPELSLQTLAKELKIPKHHLTQLLSLRLGENFYHYVNRFRIDYACKLINQSVVDLTLEELAYKSGFNSKTSFNRYFKKQLGCTPSEYRNL